MRWIFLVLVSILVREVAKHPSEALVEVFRVESMGFYGVTTAFQKLGLGDSISRRCNRVCLESVELGGVVTVTNPMAIQLKDTDIWKVWVVKQVVNLQVGAEDGPLGVEMVFLLEMLPLRKAACAVQR